MSITSLQEDEFTSQQGALRSFHEGGGTWTTLSMDIDWHVFLDMSFNLAGFHFAHKGNKLDDSWVLFQLHALILTVQPRIPDISVH